MILGIGVGVLLLVLCLTANGREAPLDPAEMLNVRSYSDKIRREGAFPFD